MAPTVDRSTEIVDRQRSRVALRLARHAAVAGELGEHAVGPAARAQPEIRRGLLVEPLDERLRDQPLPRRRPSRQAPSLPDRPRRWPPARRGRTLSPRPPAPPPRATRR